MLRHLALLACTLQAALPAYYFAPLRCRFQPRATEDMSTEAPSYLKARAAVEKARKFCQFLRAFKQRVTTVQGTESIFKPSDGMVVELARGVATSHFDGVETIGAKDVLELRQMGKKVLLVDVRTEGEMKVSILRGSVTQEKFENSSMGESARTGTHYEECFGGYGGEGNDWDVVVPYCTAGYRSGLYAKKLIDLGYPSVRNSEGVVLWTHDVGSGLVAPKAGVKKAQGNTGDGSGNDAGTDHGNGAGDGAGNGEEIKGDRSGNDAGTDHGDGAGDRVGNGEDVSGDRSGHDAGADHGNGAGDEAGNGEDVEVKRVHVYAKAWDNAREDFETITFSRTGWVIAAATFVVSKLSRKNK